MRIYCPGCANEVTDEVRFCKRCGANLRGVKEAMQPREQEGRFDWSKTWVADMLLTEDERVRRRTALQMTGRVEDLVAAEVKRVGDLEKEIKGGIITTFAGVGITAFLIIFMWTIASIQADERTATILRSIWAAGLIPIMVGLGILVNALVVGRRFAALRQGLVLSALASAGQERADAAPTTGGLSALDAPPAALAAEPPAEPPSVTEHTTQHLAGPGVSPAPGRLRE